MHERTASGGLGPNGAGGFTLIEMLAVVALISILAGMAVPVIGSTLRWQALIQSQNLVGATVRGARYAAVSKNRTMRVLFNCPAANRMRVVELTGNAAIDNDALRCSEVAYPFPDPNPAALPNLDGPVITLSDEVQFAAAQSIQISPAGRVDRLTGCPACATAAAPAVVTVTGTHFDAPRTITINQSGRIQMP